MEELEDETELLEALSRAEPDRGEKGADGGTAEEIQPTGAEINSEEVAYKASEEEEEEEDI